MKMELNEILKQVNDDKTNTKHVKVVGLMGNGGIYTDNQNQVKKFLYLKVLLTN
jgi:hypothetical protein